MRRMLFFVACLVLFSGCNPPYVDWYEKDWYQSYIEPRGTPAWQKYVFVGQTYYDDKIKVQDYKEGRYNDLLKYDIVLRNTTDKQIRALCEIDFFYPEEFMYGKPISQPHYLLLEPYGSVRLEGYSPVERISYIKLRFSKPTDEG